jgi:hypothetical protein
MEFHVWDFSSIIEVRLSDEMINRIRNLTATKRILVKDTHPRVNWRKCGWRKPHFRKPFYMEKEVKLIALADGHPYHNIAERLYPVVEHHGPGRNSTPHKPYISIDDLRTVQKVTGIPKEELESSVISVRNHTSLLGVNMRFPVVADEDWAWLFGYYFSCGSLVTRDRIGKDGYPMEERLVRFKVERQVFEKKVQPILERVGYVPALKSVWYEKYGGHPLDKQRRVGTGNAPRKIIYLPRVIREVMEYFGLYVSIPKQKPIKRKEGSIRGRVPLGSRRFKLYMPAWIEKYPQKFLEGFINGGQLGSQLTPRPKGIAHIVELRAGFKDPADTITLINFFREQLGRFGITGTPHRITHREGESVYWLGFEIYNKVSLTRLFENFDIQVPTVRARLCVHYFMNTLLYEACRRLHNIEILVVGALMEKPRTDSELIDIFRLRNEQVADALKTLGNTGFVIKKGEFWRIVPTGIKNKIVTDLAKEDMERRDIVTTLNGEFFSRCNSCGNVIPHNYLGACGCGGMFEPIERFKVLKRYAQRNGAKIAHIQQEEVPQEVNQAVTSR